ncbi:MAG: hypothetical protein FD167_1743 [bacterium]|nr:MAG: hypothetical protein FD167_1743 [bacterium]
MIKEQWAIEKKLSIHQGSETTEILPNETFEAYTEKRVGHREKVLVQPR